MTAVAEELKKQGRRYLVLSSLDGSSGVTNRGAVAYKRRCEGRSVLRLACGADGSLLVRCG
jgi:hypothetical protein